RGVDRAGELDAASVGGERDVAAADSKAAAKRPDLPQGRQGDAAALRFDVEASTGPVGESSLQGDHALQRHVASGRDLEGTATHAGRQGDGCLAVDQDATRRDDRDAAGATLEIAGGAARE